MDPAMMAALRQGAIFYLILAGSIALHEFGHAKVADLVGDYLPREQGRVTLNPFAHLDPIGTGLIPLAMIFLPILTNHPMPLQLIGWGRPVQISLPNPRTRKRDEILITLAGPGMNVLIALGTAIVGGLVERFSNGRVDPTLAGEIILMNAMLIAFNLIPLPPLDGSRLLRHLIGMSEEAFGRMMMYTPIILLILINTSGFQHILGEMTDWVATPFFHGMFFIAGNPAG
jgi:Zn-dependent protease